MNVFKGAQMKHFFFIFLLPLSSLAANEPLDDAAKACKEALDDAKEGLEDYSRDLLIRANNNSHAVDAPTQTASTGNPVTDLINQMSANNQKMAEAAQQESQARSQAEDDCFRQLTSIEDQVHSFRQKDYERRREINRAETEKLKEESQIRIACHAESAKLAQAERVRLAEYRNRTVSTVGGATGSQKQVRELQSRFYNECLNSGATREAFRSAQDVLNMQMNNFKIQTEEIMSDIAYQDTKTARLDAHCQLRQDRISQQSSIQKNSIRQSQLMNMMSLSMALKTANANTDGQEQVRNSFGDIENILGNWGVISERCANQGNATAKEVDAVPADVFSRFFSDVNKSCRPEGDASGTKNCVTSTGINSTEKQRADSTATK